MFKSNCNIYLSFIKMELQFQFQLFMWNKVALWGLKVCFAPYDLFIVIEAMLDC
jgi:hypothetical protein